MKILRLNLNNLASFADIEPINFEDSPLAHAGLIAITGKTGAGKSTLLDAMCLALYDEVPRLRGAAGSIKDAGGKDISIKDSKHILRRGTTSGFAELEFIALDGKRYQARWEVRRAHKKVDGNLKVDRSVKCLDDGTTLTQRISEVTPLIEKLIGLSFEQFTRAVLLAQSEVGAFLKAKDHERADLLEYLTNSQIFTLVSKKAADKYSEIKQQRADLEKLIGHLDILSDDELNSLNQQHQTLKLLLDNLSQSEKLLENDLKWHKDRHALYSSTQAKKEVYDVQLEADLKLQPQKQLLAQLDAFQPIRARYQERDKSQFQLNQLNQALKDFQPQLSAAQTQRDHATQQLHAAEQSLQVWLQHFEQLKPQLEKASNLDHEIQSKIKQHQAIKLDQQQFLDAQVRPVEQQLQQQQSIFTQTKHSVEQRQQQLQQQQQWAIFDEALATTVQRLQDYVQRYQQLVQDHPALLQHSIQTLQQQQTDLRQRIQQWSQQHKNIDLFAQKIQTTQQRVQQQDQQIRVLERLEQQTQQLIQNEQQFVKFQQQFEQSQSLCFDLEQKIAAQQKQVQLSNDALQQLELIFEQQRLLQHQSVQDLRAQLKANEACMVCGSHQHPFVEHENLLSDALGQLQDQQLQHAKHEAEQQRLQLNNLEIQYAKIEATTQRQQGQLQDLSKTVAAQQQTIHAAITAQQLPFDLQKPSTDLLTSLKIALEHASQTSKQQQVELEQDRDTIAAWQQAQQQAEQLGFGLQQRQQLEQAIEPLHQQFSTEQQRQWTAQPLNYAQYMVQQLQLRQQGLFALNEQQKQLEQIESECNQTQLKLDLLQQQSTEKLAQLNQVHTEGSQLREELNQLTETYAGFKYQKVSEWQAVLDQEQQKLQQAIVANRNHLKLAEDHLQDLQLKQQNLNSQITLNTQQLQQALQQIAAWNVAHPEIQPDVIEQCLAIQHEQHQQIRQDLLNHQQTLESAKTSWQTLEEQYAQHLKQQPEHEFEVIEQKLNDLSLEKTQQQDACNELNAKLHMNASNQSTYTKYQTQIEQIKAEEYRWGRIYDLIGHKEGTKFKKIAQEHHLDILVEYANQQLQPLSQRYQLHRIPDSLSLAIIDLDMNSEIRPVLSLSGGETFLVSLALALAIANMASGSMKLESLFIDEGFGTLDPASLHMVMNALDHLQSQGRKVVLISHIQEMHERIPVQIQVKPVGAGASTIQVVG